MPPIHLSRYRIHTLPHALCGARNCLIQLVTLITYLPGGKRHLPELVFTDLKTASALEVGTYVSTAEQVRTIRTIRTDQNHLLEIQAGIM